MYNDMCMHERDYVDMYEDDYDYVYKMKGEDTSESLIMYSDL